MAWTWETTLGNAKRVLRDSRGVACNGSHRWGYPTRLSAWLERTEAHVGMQRGRELTTSLVLGTCGAAMDSLGSQERLWVGAAVDAPVIAHEAPALGV